MRESTGQAREVGALDRGTRDHGRDRASIIDSTLGSDQTHGLADLSAVNQRLERSEADLKARLQELENKLKQLEEKSVQGGEKNSGEAKGDLDMIYRQMSNLVKKEEFEREKALQNHRNSQLQADITASREAIESDLQQLRVTVQTNDQSRQREERDLSNSLGNLERGVGLLREEIRDVNELVLLGDVFTVNTQEADSLVPLRLPEQAAKDYDRGSIYGIRCRLEVLEDNVGSYLKDARSGRQFSEILDSERGEDPSFVRSFDKDRVAGLTAKDQTDRLQQQRDDGKVDELKRTLEKRLKEMRQEVIQSMKSLERQLDGKQSKADYKQHLHELEDRQAELKLMIAKKAEGEGVRKALNFLEKNLKDIFEYLMSNESERDALAAKRGWACLSCDRNLMDYQGHVGDYVVWDKLPGTSPPRTQALAKERARSFLERKVGKMSKTTTVVRK